MEQYKDLEEIMKRMRKAYPNKSTKELAKLVGDQVAETPIKRPDLLKNMASAVGTAGDAAGTAARRVGPVAGGVALGMLDSKEAAAPEPTIFDRNTYALREAEKRGNVSEMSLMDRIKAKSRTLEPKMSPRADVSLFQRAKQANIRAAERGKVSTDIPPEEVRVAVSERAREEAAPVEPAPTAAAAPAAEPVSAPSREPASEAKPEADHLTALLLGAVPTALGAAFGGWRGGATGAAVGERAVGQYYGDIKEARGKIEEREFKSKEARAKQADELEQIKARGAEEERLLGKRFEFEKGQKALDRAQREKAIGVQARIAALKATQGKGGSAAGRPMTTGAAQKIGGYDAGLQFTQNLEDFVEKNTEKMGPVVGMKADVPIVGRYTDQAKVQQFFDNYRQNIGKALEGGVLRKDDWDKYGILLPTVKDTPELAMEKIRNNRRIIATVRDMELSSLSRAGYYTGQETDVPAAAPPAVQIDEDDALNRLLELTE